MHRNGPETTTGDELLRYCGCQSFVVSFPFIGMSKLAFQGSSQIDFIGGKQNQLQ